MVEFLQVPSTSDGTEPFTVGWGGHNEVQLQFTERLTPPPDAEDGWEPFWEPLTEFVPGGSQYFQSFFDLPAQGGFFRAIELDDP